MTDNRHNETTKQPDDPRQAGFPALSIDWELYGEYLEDSDLSEDDKRACIEALWSIMVSFVDMGFRLSPLQEVCREEICGEVAPLEQAVSKAASHMVKSKDTNNAFRKAADGDMPSACGEGVADDQ